MYYFTKRHFKSFEKLTAFIDKNFTYFNEFIFRGQADSEWKLETSLERAFKRDFPPTGKILKSQKLAILKKHLNSFKENIRGRCGIDFKNISEDELWSIGQHFGLHTPLLDWTSSPYVALYFALEYPTQAKKGCIWALSETFLGKIETKKTTLKLKRIKPLSNENPRLVSQQGLFLKVPFGQSIESVIEKYRTKKLGVDIYKITFETNIRYEALSALNNMNINKLTLYPDLVGAALHSNYQFEIAPQLLKGRSNVWARHIGKLLKAKVKVKKTTKGLEARIIGYPIKFRFINESELHQALLDSIQRYAKKAGYTVKMEGEAVLARVLKDKTLHEVSRINFSLPTLKKAVTKRKS